MSKSSPFSETEKKTFREMVPMSSIAEREFLELCLKCGVENGDPDTRLFRQGEFDESLYFLLAGTVGLSIGRVTIETIQAGSAAARFALAHQSPRKVTATALTPIRFVRVDKALLPVEEPASRFAAPMQSLTDLVLCRTQAVVETDVCARQENPGASAFKRVFAWFRTGSRRPLARDVPDQTETSSNDHLAGANRALGEPRLFPKPDSFAAGSTDPDPVARIDPQSPLLQPRWKRDLPREIAMQLQLTLVPLMRDISDISGSLVATEHGSLRSPDFPAHRINRIQAIARAATNLDCLESLEFPEEILLREKNSLTLIFLMGRKGLLALHSNITANLGLIRLEASPVASRVREIIWNES